MSSTKTRTKGRPDPRKTRRRSGASVGLLVSGAVFVLAITIAVFARGSSSEQGGLTAGEQAVTALQPVGGDNAMGFPYVSTPGSAQGEADAGGIIVQGADWSLGHVPLSVAVRPEWTLTNTTDAPITLGEPQAEIRQGCCPGPFVFSSKTVEPGASVTMTFELAMHEGMDGWHDMLVHVPVSGPKGDADLVLSVTGDFRN